MTLSPDHTEPEIVRWARVGVSACEAAGLYAGVLYRQALDIIEAFEAGRAEAQAALHPAADALGMWMSAALDDPTVCEEMKADIQAWFAAGQPLPGQPPPWRPTAAEVEVVIRDELEKQIERRALKVKGRVENLRIARDWLRELWMAPGVDGLVSHLGDALEAALTQAERPAVDAGVIKPITMQDVRLAVGEGPLKPQDVLAGCNAELRRRAILSAVGGEDGTN